MANKKRVIFFKSDDGALHETEEACDRANNLLAAKPRILEMLASENPDAVPFTPEFVADWMIKSAPDLAQLLSNLLPPVEKAPRKPRRTKAEIQAEAQAKADFPEGQGAAPEVQGDVTPEGQGATPEAQGDVTPEGQGATPEAQGDVTPEGQGATPEAQGDVTPEGQGAVDPAKSAPAINSDNGSILDLGDDTPFQALATAS